MVLIGAWPPEGGVHESAYKGFFATGAALATAVPVAKDGDFAGVADTDTFWLWDSDIADWNDSGSGGIPAPHAASHVNGTDDIQDATESQKGLASIAQIIALNGKTLKHGFDRDNLPTLSIDGSDAKLTGTYTLWLKGVPFTKTDDTVALPGAPVAGSNYYVKYNSSGTLVIGTTIWSLLTEAPVCYLVTDAAGNFITGSDDVTEEIFFELHGWSDPAYHEYNHVSTGTAWGSGLATVRIGDGAGDTDDDLQVDVSVGEIHDEDIEIITIDGAGNAVFEQVLSPAELPGLYRSGANGFWLKQVATVYPILFDGGNTYPSWNEFTGGAWQKTELANNKWGIYFAIKTAMQTQPVFYIPGQAQYDSEADARAASFSDMTLGDVLPQEWSLLGKIILKAQASFINVYKAAIIEILDLRGELGGAAGNAAISNHASLGGRSNSDQHPDTAITNTSSIQVDTVQDALNDLDDEWKTVSTDDYTATPDSTSRLLMSDTSKMVLRGQLEYTIGGTKYYGVVSAISTNSHVDIIGAPLTGGDITLLRVAQGRLSQWDEIDAGTYGDGIDMTLLLTDMKRSRRWKGPDAACIGFSAWQRTVDTGTQAKVNMQLAGNAVSNNDSSKGVQLGAAETWIDNPAIAINVANYSVTDGDLMDIACPEAGGTGDARDLSFSAWFVRI